MNRRDFLLSMAQLGAALNTAPILAPAEKNDSQWPDMSWWYRSPASRYWEGIPLSNGRLAAMVHGRIDDELIPINEESLHTTRTIQMGKLHFRVYGVYCWKAAISKHNSYAKN